MVVFRRNTKKFEFNFHLFTNFKYIIYEKIILFMTLHDDFYIKIKRLNFEAHNQNKLSLYDKIILNKNRKYF